MPDCSQLGCAFVVDHCAFVVDHWSSCGALLQLISLKVVSNSSPHWLSMVNHLEVDFSFSYSTNNYFLNVKLYLNYVFICVCKCVHVSAGIRYAWDCNYKQLIVSLHGQWKPNSGLQQEQYALLTREASLQPQEIVYGFLAKEQVQTWVLWQLNELDSKVKTGLYHPSSLLPSLQ